MTPNPQQEWADVPALARMRDELEQLTARDAERARPPRRRRAPRRGFGLAVAGLLAAAVVSIVLLASRDEEAVADLRDAPEALLEAGRYAFTSTITTTAPTGTSRLDQAGTADLKADAYRVRTSVAGRLRSETIGAGNLLYGRTARDPGWQRLTLRAGTALSGASAPASLSSVRALRDAVGERIVSDDELVDGIRTTHYRVAMTADAYAGLRGQDGADLHGVRGELDVWLDGDDLPRRVRASFARDGTHRFAVDTRYARFGQGGPITTPAQARDVGGSSYTPDPIVGSLRALFGGG